MGQRDSMLLMHGPSPVLSYCTLSISRTMSAVTAQLLMCVVSPTVSITVTPAPSTPGIAVTANSATSWSS